MKNAKNVLTLDHLTVVAPTLAEGVEHVRASLDLDVPFGTRHVYMGTHNHRLQLGKCVYLEIVAADPQGTLPDRPRWFGLDDPPKVRADWDAGRRLRGWVAATTSIEACISATPAFGEAVLLPPDDQEFAFAIPRNGSLPMDGALPSLIDHRGDPTSMADIPDLGARLTSFSLEHPEPERLSAIYDELCIDRAPEICKGPVLRYSALIDTPSGERCLV